MLHQGNLIPCSCSNVPSGSRRIASTLPFQAGARNQLCYKKVYFGRIIFQKIAIFLQPGLINRGLCKEKKQSLTYTGAYCNVLGWEKCIHDIERQHMALPETGSFEYINFNYRWRN